MAYTKFTEDIDELLNILDEAAITNDNIDGLDFAEFMYGEGPAETMNEGFDWEEFMSTLPPSDPMGPSFVNTQFEQQTHQPFLESFDFSLPPFDGMFGQLNLDLNAGKPTDGMYGHVEGWTDGLFEELQHSILSVLLLEELRKLNCLLLISTPWMRSKSTNIKDNLSRYTKLTRQSSNLLGIS